MLKATGAGTADLAGLAGCLGEDPGPEQTDSTTNETEQNTTEEPENNTTDTDDGDTNQSVDDKYPPESEEPFADENQIAHWKLPQDIQEFLNGWEERLVKEMQNYNAEVNEQLRKEGNAEYQVDNIVVYPTSAHHEFFQHPDEQTFLLRPQTSINPDSVYGDITAQHQEAPNGTDEVMAWGMTYKMIGAKDTVYGLVDAETYGIKTEPLYDLPQIGLELRGAHNGRAVVTMDDAEFTDTFESYLHKQGTDVKLDYVGLKNDLKDQLQYFGE